MISAQNAISRTRRDLAFGTLIKVVLVVSAIGCMVAGPLLDARFDASVALLIIVMIGMMLSFRSVRGSRMAAEVPLLLASKQYDVAENRLEQALRSFSIFKTVKLMNLHQLAMLRHAQRRWTDAAMLCRVLVRSRSAQSSGLGKSSHLMLASALLALDDLRGTHENLLRLYQHRLSLGEAVRLLLLQLEYEARIGAWNHMLRGVGPKVHLCELMPPEEAARAYRLLVQASEQTDRQEWARWLGRRAQLLAPAQGSAVHEAGFRVRSGAELA